MSDQMLRTYFLPFLWIVGGVYVALAVYISSYIQANYPSQWDELGRPAPLNYSIKNTVRFLRFFIFSSLYKGLNDERVNLLVIFERSIGLLFVVLFLLVIFGMAR